MCQLLLAFIYGDYEFVFTFCFCFCFWTSVLVFSSIRSFESVWVLCIICWLLWTVQLWWSQNNTRCSIKMCWKFDTCNNNCLRNFYFMTLLTAYSTMILRLKALAIGFATFYSCSNLCFTNLLFCENWPNQIIKGVDLMYSIFYFFYWNSDYWK